ncbi:MAG: phosphohistidine phosphatase SixA [Polyangiaceae bacterium]
MKIYVMRHGPAEDEAASGKDGDRVLTPSGRDRVRLAARELIQRGKTPHAVLSSPLARARQTADILIQEAGLGADALELRNELAMTDHVATLVNEVVAAKRKRVVLVGHEPELSSLVFELTGTSLIMQKAMIVAISFKADGRTVLKFVIDPKLVP